MLLQQATDRATEAIDKAGKNWTGAWAALTDSTTVYVNNALNKVAFDILNHSRALGVDEISLQRLAWQQNREAAAMAQAQAMLDEALDGLKNQLIADFMKEIGDRSEFAQDRFDTITNHGREPISNEEAMARAIADEAEHRKNSQR